MGSLKKLVISLIATSQLVLAADTTKLGVGTFLKDYPQLKKFILQGWENNQQLKASDNDHMAAKALQEAAVKNWFPRFWANSSISRQRSFNSTENYSTTYSNSLNIAQPLWDSEIHYQAKTAKSVANQFKWSNLSFKNQLAFNILATYFEYLTKLKDQATYKTIIGNVEKRQKNVQAEVELGQKLKVDLLEIKAQLLEKKYQLTQSENEAEQAVDLLSLLINQKLTTKSLNKTALPLLNLPETDKLVTASLIRNPALQQAREQEKELEYRYNQLKSELVPTLYVSGNWGYESEESIHADSPAENWQIGVNLVWKFGDLTRSSRRLAALRHKQSATATLSYQTKQLPTEIRTTSLQLKTIKANLVSLQIRIKQLEEAYRMRQEQYRAGRITITDLTIAEDDLLQAQIDYTKATSEYNITAMQLWVLAGGNDASK